MKNILCVVVILCLFVTPCFAGAKAKKGVRQGNLLYNKGDFQDALKQYEDALLDSPNSDVVNFNLGAALYKIKDYEKAVGHFERSLTSDDKSLEQKASYNAGNSKYKYGISKENTDLQGAVDLLKQSLRHYERAVQLESKDEDAKYNYEFVKKELQRLEKKLEQEQQQKQTQQKQKESEDNKTQSQQQQAEQKQFQEEQAKQGQANKEEAEQNQEQKESMNSQEESKIEEEQANQKQASESREWNGQMSEKEAMMLLESYRQEEEPKGLFKEKIPTRGVSEPEKDW